MAEQAPGASTLDRLRSRFGDTVADEMGYDHSVARDIGRHLNVRLDGIDAWMQFDCCGDEQTVSPVEEGQLEGVILSYARHIADDLKEHRGRDGEHLPWDS